MGQLGPRGWSEDLDCRASPRIFLGRGGSRKGLGVVGPVWAGPEVEHGPRGARSGASQDDVAMADDEMGRRLRRVDVEPARRKGNDPASLRANVVDGRLNGCCVVHAVVGDGVEGGLGDVDDPRLIRRDRRVAMGVAREREFGKPRPPWPSVRDEVRPVLGRPAARPQSLALRADRFGRRRAHAAAKPNGEADAEEETPMASKALLHERLVVDNGRGRGALNGRRR
jgi:hypothetical protein